MLPPSEGSEFKVLRTGLNSSLVHFLGASVGLGDGDLNGCTSCDGDSDDITFAFHSCLVCGLDLGRVGFTGSSSSSHPFLGIDSFGFRMIDVSS